MNKRQAKKGRNPHGSYRRIKKEGFWQPIYPLPRWRKRTLWIEKQWSFRYETKVKGDKE